MTIHITVGDARLLSKDIPDGSVDLVVTDPPYPRKFRELYSWLSHEAARVLKPGRYLWVYAGEMDLDLLMRICEDARLVYQWDHSYLNSGAHPRWWSKKRMVGAKHILELTKGTPFKRLWMDTVHTSTRDKKWHKWGQGIEFPIKAIEMFSEPGELVWDPFVGGGQIPAACELTGRRFIGSEIDPVVAAKALEHLEEVRRDRSHDYQPVSRPARNPA
jgi:site-specific DNA-methyltransferase (adenine-specific)